MVLVLVALDVKLGDFNGKVVESLGDSHFEVKVGSETGLRRVVEALLGRLEPIKEAFAVGEFLMDKDGVGRDDVEKRQVVE